MYWKLPFFPVATSTLYRSINRFPVVNRASVVFGGTP